MEGGVESVTVEIERSTTLVYRTTVETEEKDSIKS